MAGRNLGFWTFTLLVVASICNGMTILGVAGLGYATSWPSIWEQIFVPLCAAVCILFFGTKMHAVAARPVMSQYRTTSPIASIAPGAFRAPRL